MAEWAAQAGEGRLGHPQRPPPYDETFQAVRTRSADSMALLAEAIDDMGKPAIVRVTAADRLAAFGEAALPSLSQALNDDSVLVRAHPASGFTVLPPAEGCRDRPLAVGCKRPRFHP